MTDEEKLQRARQRWPELAALERAAEERLRAVIGSGDPARIPEGSQALADWIDARVAMIVYGDCEAGPSREAPDGR